MEFVTLHVFHRLQCDGTPLDLAHGPSLQGVALLNIPFTHGGSNLWGEHHTRHRLGKRKKRPDKELSTSSFNSVDLTAAIQGKLFIQRVRNNQLSTINNNKYIFASRSCA